MDNTNLQDYIEKALAAGSSIDQIRQNLLSAGWQQSVVEPYLINQTGPQAQIVQPIPTINPTITTTASYSNIGTIAESSKPKVSALTKVGFGLLLLGIVPIVAFIALTTVGKSVYLSPKIDFSQNGMQEQNIDLKTADNPYRAFIYAKYTIKGDPFGLRNKLFDYSFSITDEEGTKITSSTGTYEYHENSSSSDSKTSLSVLDSSISLPLKDFQIEKDGIYKIEAQLAVLEPLDSSFTLSDWNYEIKGKVLKPPLFLIISGLILVCVSFVLLFIAKSKESVAKLNQ